jgi:hypothetical protein
MQQEVQAYLDIFQKYLLLRDSTLPPTEATQYHDIVPREQAKQCVQIHCDTFKTIQPQIPKMRACLQAPPRLTIVGRRRSPEQSPAPNTRHFIFRSSTDPTAATRFLDTLVTFQTRAENVASACLLLPFHTLLGVLVRHELLYPFPFLLT